MFKRSSRLDGGIITKVIKYIKPKIIFFIKKVINKIKGIILKIEGKKENKPCYNT